MIKRLEGLVAGVQLKEALISDAVEGREILEGKYTPDWIEELAPQRLKIFKKPDSQRLYLLHQPTDQIVSAGDWIVRLPNGQTLVMTNAEWENLK